MDFSNVNMPNILKGGMRNKFQDFSPSDFEDFISQLFRDNGYHVEQTSYSGDYGADLIINDVSEKVAVQVKRFSIKNKVGVKDINQIIGAKYFYHCDRAIIITTSSFSNQGKALAKETSTELWDWNKLQKYICDTYLDSKDYYDFFSSSLEEDMGEKSFMFRIEQVHYEMQMNKIGLCTLLPANIINLTDRNINIDLKLPTFISIDNKQIKACYWFEGYFLDGVVYAGCKVEIAFMFKTDQLPLVKVGDRIIFEWYEEKDNLHTCDITIPTVPVKGKTEDYEIPDYKPSKSSCYIVTMCFGVESAEYREAIFFRDNILLKYNIGNDIINIYYKLGGSLVKYLRYSNIAKLFSRYTLKIILILVKRWNRRYEKSALHDRQQPVCGLLRLRKLPSASPTPDC